MQCSQATSVDRASESLFVIPGLPGYEELISAVEECEQQLEAGMPGSRSCSEKVICTFHEGGDYEGHVPLRHRFRTTKVCSLGFADPYVGIEQMWAAELMILLDANMSNFLKGIMQGQMICFLLWAHGFVAFLSVMKLQDAAKEGVHKTKALGV